MDDNIVNLFITRLLRVRTYYVQSDPRNKNQSDGLWYLCICMGCRPFEVYPSWEDVVCQYTIYTWQPQPPPSSESGNEKALQELQIRKRQGRGEIEPGELIREISPWEDKHLSILPCEFVVVFVSVSLFSLLQTKTNAATPFPGLPTISLFGHKTLPSDVYLLLSSLLPGQVDL